MSLREKLREGLARVPFFGQIFGQVATPPITIIIHGEPTLTITVNKTDGYIGETFIFSGEFRDYAGEPINTEVTLYEGTNVVGTDPFGASWMISWIPAAPGSYTFHAEAELPPV